MIIPICTEKDTIINLKSDSVSKNGLPLGFTITDSNLTNIYPHLIRNPYYAIEAGEKSKSLEVYGQICEKLTSFRQMPIIAFGGGVVGDLAGFVASTYRRGTEFIQVPTSLVAMADSSIGGKNGINLGDKKNYLGTVYQPSQIVIDPSFLKTLPKNEFKNGLAEIIKYSILFNKPSFEEIASINNSDSDLEYVLYSCANIKSNIVEKDEFDKDYRHVLNFGHTIGHSIELACNLSHGEAISIGMIKEMEIAERRGYINKNKIDEAKKMFLASGLPVELPKNFDLNKSLKIINSDKKGDFIFALDKEHYNEFVSEEEVRRVLQ